MRYFFHIGYDGTHYGGWQWQVDVESVQGKIEEVLKNVFKKDIVVYGCGRTDSGVHASQYFFHIDIDEAIDFDFKFRMNKNLPDDISVWDILEMKDNQHARFDAISRTYDYFIHFNKDPILKKYSSYYDYKSLNTEAMRTAASLLMKYDDFRSICRQPDLHNHTICKVTYAHLYVDELNERMRFTITANRFLRGMVRLCVSFLLQIGRGQMSLEEFEFMLSNQIVRPVNRISHPNGLYLSKVEYPYLSIPSRTDLCYFLKTGLE